IAPKFVIFQRFRIAHLPPFDSWLADIAKCFEDISGYEYAKTEGPNSKNSSSIRQSRMISLDGRTYEIWSHIIHGNQEPKMLRVHFAYDDERKKIIVGYVGAHMENATSRKKR
ncbi:MAG: hypothetical protein ACSHYA_20300, partial [Opitutaceae bacterium]